MEPLPRAFAEHERALWGLCYRLTGVAADADDLVQDTFVRAVESPPPRMDLPLRPWLFTLAANLARDLLRRRRRARYVGPWLPSPVEAVPSPGDVPMPDDPAFALAPEETNPETRYGLAESASFAFLLAAEALTPQQRAALIFRDVLDYSVRDTAQALQLTEGAVKVTHHRARKAMEAYDQRRFDPSSAAQAHARAALERFLIALQTNDAARIEAVLTEDVRVLNDGAGDYHAALNPIYGPAKSARLFIGLNKRLGAIGAVELRDFNGAPAVVVDFATVPAKLAPRMVMRVEVAPDGRLSEVHIVIARRKLTAVPALTPDGTTPAAKPSEPPAPPPPPPSAARPPSS